MQRRIGTIAIGLIAVLTVGLMSFGTGLASVGDVGGEFGVFADKGGNGNGGDNDKEKDKGNSNDDKDNNGQGQGNGQGNNNDEDTDTDEDSNGQGNSDKDKEKDNNAGGNGNNGQGNGGQNQDDDSDSDEDVDDATPSDDDDGNGNDKVGICHTTGSDSNSTVYIEVSENAVPAHEAHGDEIGVASEDDCDGDTGTPTPPDGTPGATPEL